MSTHIRTGDVRLKRAYMLAAVSDGKRVLIERFWPASICGARILTGSRSECSEPRARYILEVRLAARSKNKEKPFL